MEVARKPGFPVVSIDLVDENEPSRGIAEIRAQIPGSIKITDKDSGKVSWGYMTEATLAEWVDDLRRTSGDMKAITSLLKGETDKSTTERGISAYIGGELERYISFSGQPDTLASSAPSEPIRYCNSQPMEPMPDDVLKTSNLAISVTFEHDST